MQKWLNENKGKLVVAERIIKTLIINESRW